MIIGERLKDARKKKNMSQQQLGDLLGVSKVSICGYENGVRIPTIENFIQLLDEYKAKMSKDDIKIIKELKNNPVLHSKLRVDPKRTIELINRKLNK